MSKHGFLFLVFIAITALQSCSKNATKSERIPVSVRTELATVNADSTAPSTKLLSTADIQYLESQVNLTPEQRAALNEVAQ